MITILIVLVTTIILAVCFIFSYKTNNEGNMWLSGSFGFLSAIILVTLITIAALENTPFRHERTKLEYDEIITELLATRNKIQTITDDYSRSVAIQQYNTEVREFKIEIKKHQYNLKNPWINWFENYVYVDFDADVVSYL